MRLFAVLLTSSVLFFSGMCLSQTTDPNAAVPAQEQNTAISTGTEANPAPVDPQVAVPGAKDGKDPQGRPVQPVGTADVQPPPPVPATTQQEFSQNVKDVYFDFNRWQLKADDRDTLKQDAEWLKAHRDVIFTIAGQADPRGNIVYNLFLSDQRALATRDALLKLGVSPQQILFAQGWGKLYRVCNQEDESCWSQDRRAHMDPWSPVAGPLTNAGATAASGEE
jgi:peptidoglycan-associated lipoprotein